MLRELVDELYSNWDLIKRSIKSDYPQFYERWKAGGYIVDEDVLSMYPCLSQIMDIIDEEQEDEEDE
jgi:aryl carrier-like protein